MNEDYQYSTGGQQIPSYLTTLTPVCSVTTARCSINNLTIATYIIIYLFHLAPNAKAEVHGKGSKRGRAIGVISLEIKGDACRKVNMVIHAAYLGSSPKFSNVISRGSKPISTKANVP